jgi:hypothetical protein
MIPITGTFSEYWQLVYIVTGFGALGGLAYELLQSRFENTGTVELPGRRVGRILDLGWLASIIIGAITALALLYVFPPVIQVTANPTVATGATETNDPETGSENEAAASDTETTLPPPDTYYDVVKVIALSIIAGSAGPAFLTGLQARVLAVVNAQRAETIKEVSKKQVEALGKATSKEVADKVRLAISNQKSVIEDLVQQASSNTPPYLFQALQSNLKDNLYTVPGTTRQVKVSPPANNLQKRLDAALSALEQAAVSTAEAEVEAQIKSAKDTIDAASGTKTR